MACSGPLLGIYNPGLPPPGGGRTEGTLCPFGMAQILKFRACLLSTQGQRGRTEPRDYGSLQTKHRGWKQGLHLSQTCHSGRDVIPTLHPQHTPSASSGRSWSDVDLHDSLSSSCWGPPSPNLTPISTWNSLRRGDSKLLQRIPEFMFLCAPLMQSSPQPVNSQEHLEPPLSGMAAKGQHTLDATGRYQPPQFHSRDGRPSLYPPTRGLVSVSCQFWVSSHLASLMVIGGQT